MHHLEKQHALSESYPIIYTFHDEKLIVHTDGTRVLE